jgi:hypothetical protein
MRLIKEQPSDFIFLGILGAMLVTTSIMLALFHALLDLNNYAAFCLFIVATIFRFKENRYRRFGVGILLLLGCLNILNFTAATITFMGVLNPILCLLTLVYALINLESIKRLFRGSDEAIMAERQRKVRHYKVVFGKYSREELQKIKANKEEYPEEARIALDEIGN